MLQVAPGTAPSKTAPEGAASSGLNPLYEGWWTSGTAPPKATGGAPTPGAAPSKTASGGASSAGASGLPSALSKAYSVFQDAPFLVYGKKARTDEEQPEAIKEAAKKAAEQTRRPLPSFPLIPIQVSTKKGEAGLFFVQNRKSKNSIVPKKTHKTQFKMPKKLGFFPKKKSV